MRVSGFTTVRMRRQSISHDSATRAIPRGIVGAVRLYLPLHIQCQLLSQEQVLGCEVGVGSYRRRDQPQEVTGDT